MFLNSGAVKGRTPCEVKLFFRERVFVACLAQEDLVQYVAEEIDLWGK